MTVIDDQPDPSLELVNAALVARLAGQLGAPRLAVRAARAARRHADQVVIALSPAVARTAPAVEADLLGGVRCTADLAALLRPDTDDAERGDPT